MTERKPYLIAGGGIGGLTAALALAQVGVPSFVIERSLAFHEVGAGLQLSPNATRILRRLGVLDALMELAIQPQYVRVRRGPDGAELARLPLDDAEKRWGAPYIAVHRADLLAALIERARGEDLIRISNESLLTGFIQDEKGVAITYLADGEFRRADGAALIGADGVRSTTRARAIQDRWDKPAYTGHTAWRTTLPAAGLPEAYRRHVGNLWFGERAHLVHYPLRGGSIVNVVALVEDPWRGEDDPDFWDNAGDRRFLHDRFKSWCGEARELIGAGETWLRWPLFDRPPLESFAHGSDGPARRRRPSHAALSRSGRGAGDRGRRRARRRRRGEPEPYLRRTCAIFRRPRGAHPQDPGRRAHPGPDLSYERRQGLRPRSGLEAFDPRDPAVAPGLDLRALKNGARRNGARAPLAPCVRKPNRSKQPRATLWERLPDEF